MTTAQASPKSVSKSSLVLAALLVAFGLLALASPMLAGIGVIRVLAWILFFDGIAQLAYVFVPMGWAA